MQINCAFILKKKKIIQVAQRFALYIGGKQSRIRWKSEMCIRDRPGLQLSRIVNFLILKILSEIFIVNSTLVSMVNNYFPIIYRYIKCTGKLCSALVVTYSYIRIL